MLFNRHLLAGTLFRYYLQHQQIDQLGRVVMLTPPNPDDGKVSVERTKVEGMSDFLVVPHSHTIIMQADPVLRQTLISIRTGAFDHDNDA